MNTPQRPIATAGTPRRQLRGVLLLEGLVAILIFSIAVLALVGLQARMKSAQSESKYRADASYLANELFGLMWGDLSHITNYNGLSCQSHDRCKDWLDKVTATLPNGTGAIVVNATTQVVTVTVSWRLGSGDTRRFSTQTRLATAG
jgi:type IV pilus assembly protein PilV